MCMCSMVVVWYHTTTTFGTNHHTTPKCAMRFLITTLVMVALLFLSRLIELQALTYYYFALGSNVDPSTMMSLRNLSPRRAQPAVLPGYRLAFNVKGNSWIEPSACSALKSRKYPNDTIHGVLYELARADFLSLSFSEGVPLAYRWESCHVYPYQGDADAAGARAMESGAKPVQAYVLAAQTLRPNVFIAPSPSYLRIIKDGAAFWKLDKSFQDELAAIPTAKNLLIPDGVSGQLLDRAKAFNPRSAEKQKLYLSQYE